MSPEPKTQKQSLDKDTTDTQLEGFSADELGAASIYDDPTQIAQQMRRGDESQPNPNDRDLVGATTFKDTNEGREDRDTATDGKSAGE